MHQLLVDLKKAYNAVRVVVLYNILIEFGIPPKIGKANKNMSHWNLQHTAGKMFLSDMFPIRNGLKQGDALSPLLFNFALQYSIRRIPVNQDGLKLNCTHQLLDYANGVNMLGGSIHTIK